MFDFPGVSFLYMSFIAAAVFFTIATAKRFSNWIVPCVAALVLMPLIGNRLEIRPEGISYMLFAIFIFLGYLRRDKKISFATLLLILAPLQLLWVNTHIFFIMGVGIALMFLLDALLQKELRIKKYLTEWGIVVVVLTLISFVNPFFAKGFIAPFLILKEYGYMIVENQTIFFMQKRASEFAYMYTHIVSVFVIVSLIPIARKRALRKNALIVVLTLLSMGASYWMIRMIPFFGLVSVVYFSLIITLLVGKNKLSAISQYISYICIGIIVVLMLIPNTPFSARRQAFGIGVPPTLNASAQFFKDAELSGPVFNNYDIGGFLIYHLYPDEKVFVDNRPESYSVDFFRNTYIPMQEDETVWEEVDTTHNFKVIYFFRHDRTPWAQPFLIERIKDPQWIPVFVDAYTIILVKDIPEHADIIDRYAIAEDTFVIR
jgi:hypothetical protein